jgi:tetratricopeptide (TPR) repeat protein
LNTNALSKADGLKEEGVKLFNQHDYEAANRSFQQAKDAYEAQNDYTMAAEMKVNIGLVHRSLGESQQALDLMQEALRFFQEKNDKLRIGQVLGNLAGVYLALDDKDKAETAYRDAAAVFKDLGETGFYSDTLEALGRLQLTSGKFVAGAVNYQTALSGRKNLRFTQRVILFLTNLISRFMGDKSK